ncbi:FAD-dependent oxidoreductase [Brachybacterium sp. JHP9]|uniref:FAD-dependent oxidoreductase n=1 Tax=Brachybacterium equifaecis TaxID=2910770 RepID=A0ABT0QY83_9MICO|nr:FAD-dependent oxidoreductase [Brachybacterium equifaecis]MCL6422469.1 FAD-dependent oxidoreductase [Brachybacterium equifaecis]
MSPQAQRVIVVGGGVAGLLAARRHALAGADVLVLESAPELGGAVAAGSLAGISVNLGAEAFSTASGAVGRLLAQLKSSGALTPAREIVAPRQGLGSRLVSDAGSLPSPRGGLLGIPGRPLSREARTVLGLRGALRAWSERFRPAAEGLEPGVTVDAYVRARMGDAVADRLVAPVVGGVHSADPRTLELASVLPRLPEAVREHGSLAAAVRALRPVSPKGSSAKGDSARTAGTAGTAVQALTPTMAALPAALAADVERLGGSIRTGARVTSVRPGPGGWSVSWWEGHDSSSTLTAARVVLATDPQVASALLETVPEVAAAIPLTPASPVRLVALALLAPALDAHPAGTGALVAPGTRGVRAKALTHASAKWEHVSQAAREALGPGGHIVRLSYGRPGETLPGDDGLSEEQVIDLALADASAILRTPLTRAQLREARIISWAGAMRPARTGHREALAALDAALAAAPAPLELVGAWRAGTGLDALARAEEQLSTPTEGHLS